MAESNDLADQLDAVVGFVSRGTLGNTVASLEAALTGRGAAQAAEVSAAHGVTTQLFRSALTARDTFGKVSDVIHAVAITLALPHILEPEEQIVGLSLGAGNTPGRLFDVETNLRIAEFKLSRWTGNDSGRQQPTVKDLVRLAMPDSRGRKAELYVRGSRPITWLRSTNSSVQEQLRKYGKELSAFQTSFGDPAISVSNFVADRGAHVALIDFEQLAPDLFGDL